MKLIEITGKLKATSEEELIDSIRDGVFMKDGSKLNPAYFSCASEGLTSLIGGPQIVENDFGCGKNKLTSLEGCPEYVGGDVFCGINNLASLKDIHKYIKKMGDGGIYAERNPIKSHVLGLLKIPGCKRFEMDNTKVYKIINKYLPLGDLLDCQEELIEAGFEEFAQL